MLAEADLQVVDKETPMFLPRNFVQFMLEILTVFPVLIESCVEETT